MTAEPTDAKPGPVPPDYHVHTVLCKHAEGAAAEYREAAARQGMRELCFADHAPSPSGYDPENRMDFSEFPAFLAMVQGLQDEHEPTVLLGMEADYYTGCENFLSEWLTRYPFDLVIGSVHYIGDWCFDNPKERHRWDSADIKGVWREYFALIRKLVDTRFYDVIGHFDLPKKFGHRLRDKDLKEFAQPLLDHVAAAGLCLEINTSGLRRPVAEIYPAPLILDLAREREIPICFGSDAHRPQEVGYEFGQALKLARSVGYSTFMRFRQRQPEAVSLPA